jgi:hypothetical protein
MRAPSSGACTKASALGSSRARAWPAHMYQQLGTWALIFTCPCLPTCLLLLPFCTDYSFFHALYYTFLPHIICLFLFTQPLPTSSLIPPVYYYLPTRPFHIPSYKFTVFSLLYILCKSIPTCPRLI